MRLSSGEGEAKGLSNRGWTKLRVQRYLHSVWPFELPRIKESAKSYGRKCICVQRSMPFLFFLFIIVRVVYALHKDLAVVNLIGHCSL